MKKFIATGVILCIVILGVYYIFRPTITPVPTPTAKETSMKLTSPAFENYKKIPALYTCDGKKMHPPVAISGVPSATKSLALIVDDPDAPGGTFTHWVIWNINPSTEEIAEGSVPEKSQEGTTSAGSIGFTPPCPPSSTHRYFFTLYALDAKLGLDGKATKMDVENAIAGHVMVQSLLVGVYSR
ncbi:MAG: YbhB/YbcL family Raf kinase inhibitor-like protein [Candidatus Gottesmanbacteria bacterium]|nr:YbhB/YbcL family Raf kinase inhibitor-like protein [Candidatus Gottesmanbacteria bacterium]